MDLQVRFTGCNEYQRSYGPYADHSKLVVGFVYDVEKVVVHGWHTEVWLFGHGGPYNSVCFKSAYIAALKEKLAQAISERDDWERRSARWKRRAWAWAALDIRP